MRRTQFSDRGQSGMRTPGCQERVLDSVNCIPSLPEHWAPLLEIFRLSPSPVGAAIRWVESQGYGSALGTVAAQGNTGRKLQSLWRFVPEVLAKAVVVIEKEEEETNVPAAVSNCMWMQTLPSATQANILTFLSAEHQRFRSTDLHTLAGCLLSSQDSYFWVRHAASNLVETLQGRHGGPHPSYAEEFQSRATDLAMEDYDAMPSWLEEYREPHSFLCSGLPPVHIPASNVVEPQMQGQGPSQEGAISSVDKPVLVNTSTENEMIAENTGILLGKRKRDGGNLSDAQEGGGVTKLAEETVSAAEGIEALVEDDEKRSRELLGDDLFARAELLREALQACSTRTGLPQDMAILHTAPDLSTVLKVVKPWLVDDEITVLLVRTLMEKPLGYAWSSFILKYVLLPKLISLQEPASRLLGAAVLQAGKAHPRATVDAMLLPLIFRVDGASTAHCDIINRVVKECLPPEVVSSFCHKLFCPDKERDHFWLNLCEDKSIQGWTWTEAMVVVVHNLLNKGVVLEQDTVGGLVLSLETASYQFPTSLKFGNLLLIVLTKHGPKLREYKGVLQQLTKKTSTFLTKSVLAKLACL